MEAEVTKAILDLNYFPTWLKPFPDRESSVPPINIKKTEFKKTGYQLFRIRFLSQIDVDFLEDHYDDGVYPRIQNHVFLLVRADYEKGKLYGHSAGFFRDWNVEHLNYLKRYHLPVFARWCPMNSTDAPDTRENRVKAEDFAHRIGDKVASAYKWYFDRQRMDDAEKKVNDDFNKKNRG